MEEKTMHAVAWRLKAEGYNKQREEEILIFIRKFDTMKEWVRWARAFPFKLQELNKNNKPKPIKLGIDTKKNKVRKKQN